MLKGRSTISLYDAKTGKKLSEQTNTNMVTDALDVLSGCKDKLNLMGWCREGMAMSGTYGRYYGLSPFNAMVPLATYALGGVLLWDNNITENPGIVARPKGVNEVGHAGSEYAGDDIYQGSYNANESGPIEGGYRHVWDFDTDKANGTIKCLSLTSQHGGTVGHHFNGENTKGSLFSHCYFHEGDTIRNLSYNDCYISMGDGPEGAKLGRAFYIKKNGDGSLRVYKRYQTSVFYFDIADPTKVPIATATQNIPATVTLPLTLENKNNSLYVYQGQMHEIGSLNNSTLRHKIYSMTGQLISSREITIPIALGNYNSFYSAAVYRDGYYYYFTGNSISANRKLCKTDEKGTLLKEWENIPIGAGGVIIDEHSGNIVWNGQADSNTSSTAKEVYIIYPDDHVAPSYVTSDFISCSNGNMSNDKTWQFVKFDDMCTPFWYASDGGYSFRLIPAIMSTYIATINNLEVPIVKTSAQTMKIVYEIYEE